MITLNKNGQWGRFFTTWNIEHPSNLCQLFWKCTTIPLLLMGIGIGLGYIIGGILLGHYLWIGQLFFNKPLLDPYAAWIILVFGLWVMAWVFFIKWGFQWLWRHGSTKEPSRFSPALEVVRQGYRGFKEKMCPLVTWRES